MDYQNQVTTETPPISPTAIPVRATNKPNYVLIGMGIIMVFLVGASGYTAYQNRQLQNKVDTLLTPTISKAEPTLISDKFASWKTYSNAKYGFTLKYPPGFSISPEEDSYSIVDFIGADYKIDATPMGNRSSGSFFRVMDLSKCDLKFFNRSDTNPAKVLSKTDNMTIMELPVGGEALEEKAAMINHNGTCIDIYCDSDNGCRDDQYQLFQTFLGTLKFNE
jgi:hypothetical protein